MMFERPEPTAPLPRRRLLPWRAARAWLAAILGSALAAVPAPGDTITPRVTASLGYSDNVRFQENARADGFLKLTPGLDLEYGSPANRLTASVQGDYSQYAKLDEYSRFEGGRLDARWQRQFSSTTSLVVSNVTTSTYDAPVLTPQGSLIRLRTEGGRQDQNTTGVRVEERLGPQSQAFGEYLFTYTRNSAVAERESQVNEVRTGIDYRLSPHWLAGLAVKGSLSDYKSQSDILRSEVEAKLSRLIGPNERVFATLSAANVDALSDTQAQGQARDYTTYTAQVGVYQAVSPRFEWSLSGGYSVVSGDQKSNQAAGENYPVVSGYLTWKGQLWSLTLQGESSLGEYDIYGDNSGLTLRRSLGLFYNQRVAEHLSLNTRAQVVQSDYKQDPLTSQVTESGEVTAYQVGWLLSYQLSRHVNLGMDLAHLENQSDTDSLNRQENRIIFSVMGSYPQRW